MKLEAWPSNNGNAGHHSQFSRKPPEHSNGAQTPPSSLAVREGGAASSSPGSAPPASDETRWSRETSEQVGKVEASSETLPNGRISSLKENFGGAVDLDNPSAAVERDCAEILAACGEALPSDLDTRTKMTAVPIGGGALQGVSVNGQLGLREGIPALSSLEANLATAKSAYKGKLPPKVENHVQAARSAAQRRGLS